MNEHTRITKNARVLTKRHKRSIYYPVEKEYADTLDYRQGR